MPPLEPRRSQPRGWPAISSGAAKRRAVNPGLPPQAQSAVVQAGEPKAAGGHEVPGRAAGTTPEPRPAHAARAKADAPSGLPARGQQADVPQPPGLIFRAGEGGANTTAAAQSSLLRDGLVSLLLFLLLAEWLRPLAWLADDSFQVGPILAVFGICLLIDCFRISYSWGWLIKGLTIILFIGYMFHRETFATGVWIGDLIQTIAEDFIYLAQAHFDMISGEMRTLLFLIGWTLLISVSQALMLQRQHSLWFIGATLFYLIGIQLLVGADTLMGIVRTLGYGLVLLALLNLSRIETKYHVPAVRSGGFGAWLLVSLIVVGLVSGLGWYTAKGAGAEPLMKPLSWDRVSDRLFELYGGGDHPAIGVAAAAKTGYSDNDAVLGGPLQVDATPVFTARTTELTYWRGESKSFYDGKGWSQPSPILEPLTGLSPAAVNAEQPAVTQEVLLQSNAPNKQLFSGGKLLGVDTLLNGQGKPMSADLLLTARESGKVVLPDISDALAYYKITVQPVREDPTLLNTDTGAYPEAIKQQYLQLPDGLPRTVRSLAEQVTAGRATPYAKTIAVEQYLRQTYTYSLDHVTHPSRSEDFVSHFLFMDQAGYCDQFSTAMAVMLRSVGVPTRWVKGFAPGTLQATGENGLQEVIVSNQDAHAWVEVYFPSMGWVPFEPTPSFSGISPDQPRETLTTADMKAASMTASLTGASFGHPYLDQASDWLHTVKNNLVDFAKAYRSMLMIVLGLLLALLSVFALLKRKGYLLAMGHKLPAFADAALPQGPPHPLTPYMDRLWRQLFRKYGAKPAGQTVREYVLSLELKQPGQKQALLTFAQIYESVRYDPACATPYARRDITAIWNAIQKTQ
ncbi:transglutaminase domain-containing protein [Paenibacillus oryzisoli]|uniref:transglutaminase TgpA family protein n=1 Tax=Paenibacillus oryzisoli TaxID=1850517 RepID=UPI003D271CB5